MEVEHLTSFAPASSVLDLNKLLNHYKSITKLIIDRMNQINFESNKTLAFRYTIN